MKLYLDVDGVINPDDRNSWPDFRWERSGLGYVMAISDQMISELLRVVNDNDIELVWATTWVIDGNCETHLTHLYNIPTNLRMIEWMPGDSFEIVRGCGKLFGVRLDAGEDEDIIWIDDCLGIDDYRWANTRKGRSLLLKTNPRDGLTADNILEIEEFAKEERQQ